MSDKASNEIDTIKDDLIDQLISYCDSHELTVGDLSQITQIDKARLSKILNKKTTPTLDYLIKLFISLDYKITVLAKKNSKIR